MSDQSKTISYNDERAKEIVERFCAHVHWLVSVRYAYKILFEDEHLSCVNFMEKTASSFFADLNRILQEYLLLECAKITDPAKSGKYENLTVDFLVQEITWPDDKAILNRLTSLPDDDKDIQKKLRSLQKIAGDFRMHIEPARDKLLAHLDRGSVLSGKPLGGFREGEDKCFFEALQELCNITHEVCVGTICGEMSPVVPGGGDVIDLRKALACAVAFKEALSESTGETETWLNSHLAKARHASAPPNVFPPPAPDTTPRTPE